MEEKLGISLLQASHLSIFSLSLQFPYFPQFSLFPFERVSVGLYVQSPAYERRHSHFEWAFRDY